jgi:LemA protein
MTTNNKALIALVVFVCALPFLLIMAGLFIETAGWELFLIILGMVAIIVFGRLVAGMRNSLAQDLNRCHQAWLDLNAELQRRHDLVASLVSTASAYMSKERKVLEQLTMARNAAVASHGPPTSRARDESALVSVLRQLLVVADGYPDLKANESFPRLRRESVDIENRIRNAQTFYNVNVRDYNGRLQVFPWALIADLFGFKPRESFTIESVAEMPTPAAKVYELPPRQADLPSGETSAEPVQTAPTPQLIQHPNGNTSPEPVGNTELAQTETEEPLYVSPYPIEEPVGSRLPGATPGSGKVTRRTSPPAWPGWPSGLAGPDGPSS